MRPQLSSASSDFARCSTAELSCWTHRVGVAGPTRDKTTPTRNAIGLSSPVGVGLTVAMGELSPWLSVLPPRGGGAARAAAWAKLERPS